MSTPETVWRYVQREKDDKGRLIAKGTLKRGIKVGETWHKDFVLREALTGDVLDAEKLASTGTPLNYNTALLRYQLVRIGDIDAVNMDMLRGMKTIDTNILREAQAELDLAGEVEQ